MIKRLATLVVTAAAALLAFGGSSAGAACPAVPNAVGSFGIAPGCLDAAIDADAGGAAFTQAGGHPYDITTHFDFNTRIASDAGTPSPWPEEPVKDIVFDTPPGLIGNPQALGGRCSAAELANVDENTNLPFCPSSSQVGLIRLRIPLFGSIKEVSPVPVFNMDPPTGVSARFGFNFAKVLIVFDARLRSEGDYGLSIVQRGIPQGLPITGFSLTLWGVPADPSHDAERIGPVDATPRPFLTLPTSCTAPKEGLPAPAHVGSWFKPAAENLDGSPDLSDSSWKSASFVTHLPPGYPADPGTWGAPQGPEGCDTVPVKGAIEAQSTSPNAETPSGLKVRIEVPNPGLANPAGIAASAIKKVKVALPEGVTLNPSQGEGLGVCTPAQYASEELSFFPKAGTGCPADSKIGTVVTKSQLLDELLEGSVYVAKPYENPFSSLVALYIVIKNPERGVMIKLAGKVVPDEKTGQLVSTFDDIPQLPFEYFDLKFREGVRSPLATPRTCGDYTTTALFTPWSDPSKTISSESTFQITKGVGGGPCPSGATAPFKPGLQAGTLNNNALSYSPFTLRMTREDGEQEITNFSADLPPGMAAKLAGIPKCSEADLAATARAPGSATIEGSICPAASQVGRTVAGYGVGSVQTRATGKVFLAGPYRGTPVSIATVVPAVVGPFDLGTIVVRSAFRVDPETAEVHVDSRASDPIPHILKGVELHLRDIRVYMDRPNFTFNPTSCDRSRVGAFLSGSGTDFFSPADDPVADVSNPFQAANCSLLAFRPKLAFKLKGGTHRGDFPALHAVLTGRPGDANLRKTAVTLPHSEFLEQGHIKTVCTRVQFSADQCPAGSIYGYVKATTPLLDGPLQGNVYLRSNGGERLLPDLVLALRGEIEVNAVGHIDSVKGGRIRTVFESIPDTPVTKLVLDMQGGSKGLLANSRNLCLKPARADVRFTGQNGKKLKLRPKMESSCRKSGRQRRSR